METIVATAFGQRVEVQNGEASELVDAAFQVLSSFGDEEGFGVLEVTVMLCKRTEQYPLSTETHLLTHLHVTW